VLALSGGYSQEEGNNRLRRNHGIVASFSRALVEGLSVQQSDAEYNAVLDKSIQSIFEASTTKTGDHWNIGEQKDSRSHVGQRCESCNYEEPGI
jgi:fructose-bisphosphate aldolase class 1